MVGLAGKMHLKEKDNRKRDGGRLEVCLQECST
jgi:hypothetical protein